MTYQKSIAYNIFVAVLNIIILMLRVSIFPFIQLLSLLRIPFLRKRIEFERKNLKEAGAEPFEQGVKVDNCIHVSSEGELEIVMPLLSKLLEDKKNVELMFTSESVEKKVLLLYEKFPANLRYLRLPILSFFPFIIGQNINHWSKAKRLIMVRYDFFPELIMIGGLKDEFILFNAHQNPNSMKGPLWPLKKLIYSKFNSVYPATKLDQELFSKSLNEFTHKPVELRTKQIRQRQIEFDKSHFIMDLLKIKGRESSLCLAQFWPNEVSIFNKELVKEICDGNLFVYLAPHKLSEKFAREIIDGIKISYPELEIYRISKEGTKEDILKTIVQFHKKPGLVFCSVPGILCEIYPYFKEVFVGGGHGKGVHSLFEPFVAKSIIYCGPNTKRSTEYQSIVETGYKVSVVNDLSLFMGKRHNNEQGQLVDKYLEDKEQRSKEFLSLF